MKALVLVLTLMVTPLLSSAQNLDANTRQYVGVARVDAEHAAMDLIQVCLGSPLIEAGIATFAGIEELHFTTLVDAKNPIFADGKCVFKSVSAKSIK